MQGSGLGPFSYAVAASDLRPKSCEVHMHKFADDTYLVAAATHYAKILDELKNIAEWAECNNLRLNKNKTREIVFYKKRCTKRAPQPLESPGIERVTFMKVLGVTIQGDLSMNAHISNLLADCSSLNFALNTLASHGLSKTALQEIFRAKSLSKIIYASSAWWGFATVENITRINSFLKKSKKQGYYPIEGPTFEAICSVADERLLNKIIANKLHVLHRFLPEKKSHYHNLRDRKHYFVLPVKDDRNFLNRVLYKNIF